MAEPTTDEIEAIVRGLTGAGRNALLTAEPRSRSLDPESLFVTDSRGCIPGELKSLTMVTFAGLMLNQTGIAVRRHLEQNP